MVRLLPLVVRYRIPTLYLIWLYLTPVQAPVRNSETIFNMTLTGLPPNVTGSYTFTRSGGTTNQVFNLYSNNFVPGGPCTGFINSSCPVHRAICQFYKQLFRHLNCRPVLHHGGGNLWQQRFRYCQAPIL